jgi:O-antigen ligase
VSSSQTEDVYLASHSGTGRAGALPVKIFLTLAMGGAVLGMAPGILLENDVIPKLLALLTGAAGLLLCWPVWYAGVWRLLRSRRGKLLAGVLALQLVSVSFSTAVSSQPALALAGSAWRRYGLITQFALATFAFLAACCAAVRPQIVRTVLVTIAASAALVSLYAIAQYAGWDPFQSPKSYTIYYDGAMLRIPATLGHAVYLGSFLAAAIPVILWLSTRSTGLYRAGLILVAACSLLALVLSGTRSALLALLIGLTVSGMGAKRLRISRNSAMAAGGAAVVVLVALLAGDFGASFRRRLEQWRQDYAGGPRLLVWRDTLAVVARRPLLGTGPESFGNEFRRVQSPELARAYPDIFQESPHNLLLATAVEQGLPGLLALAGMVLLIFGARPPSDGPGAALKAASVATLVSLAFLTVTIQGALMLYACMALGAVEPQGAAETSETPPGRPSIIVKCLSVCLALVFAACAWAYLRQDLAYDKVGKSSARDRFSAFETIASLPFPMSGDDLWCSRQFVAQALSKTGAEAQRYWAEAAQASARAERHSDEVSAAALQSAFLAILRNDHAAAEAKLRETIDAAPNWYLPHLVLAQVLRSSMRTGEADAEVRRGLDLAGSARKAAEKALGGR